MKIKNIIWAVFAVLLSLSTQSCSGGGGDDSTSACVNYCKNSCEKFFNCIENKLNEGQIGQGVTACSDDCINNIASQSSLSNEKQCNNASNLVNAMDCSQLTTAIINSLY